MRGEIETEVEFNPPPLASAEIEQHVQAIEESAAEALKPRAAKDIQHFRDLRKAAAYRAGADKKQIERIQVAKAQLQDAVVEDLVAFLRGQIDSGVVEGVEVRKHAWKNEAVGAAQSLAQRIALASNPDWSLASVLLDRIIGEAVMNGECKPNASEIARQFGCNRSSVNRALKKISQIEELSSLISFTKSNRGGSNTWHIRLIPAFAASHQRDVDEACNAIGLGLASSGREPRDRPQSKSGARRKSISRAKKVDAQRAPTSGAKLMVPGHQLPECELMPTGHQLGVGVDAQGAPTSGTMAGNVKAVTTVAGSALTRQQPPAIDVEAEIVETKHKAEANDLLVTANPQGSLLEPSPIEDLLSRGKAPAAEARFRQAYAKALDGGYPHVDIQAEAIKGLADAEAKGQHTPAQLLVRASVFVENIAKYAKPDQKLALAKEPELNADGIRVDLAEYLEKRKGFETSDGSYISSSLVHDAATRCNADARKLFTKADVDRATARMKLGPKGESDRRTDFARMLGKVLIERTVGIKRPPPNTFKHPWAWWIDHDVIRSAIGWLALRKGHDVAGQSYSRGCPLEEIEAPKVSDQDAVNAGRHEASHALHDILSHLVNVTVWTPSPQEYPDGINRRAKSAFLARVGVSEEQLERGCELFDLIEEKPNLPNR